MSVFPNSRALSQWKIEFPKDPDEFLFMVLHTGSVVTDDVGSLINQEMNKLLSMVPKPKKYDALLPV